MNILRGYTSVSENVLKTTDFRSSLFFRYFGGRRIHEEKDQILHEFNFFMNNILFLRYSTSDFIIRSIMEPKRRSCPTFWEALMILNSTSEPHGTLRKYAFFHGTFFRNVFCNFLVTFETFSGVRIWSPASRGKCCVENV